MPRPTWKVSDLLLLVLFAGVASGASRAFWVPGQPNERLLLTIYLALLSTATMGSFLSRPTWRRAFQGYAAFGWLNLTCVLWGGFRFENDQDFERVDQGSRMGMALGVLCAIASARFLDPPTARTPTAEDEPKMDSGGNDR